MPATTLGRRRFVKAAIAFALLLGGSAVAVVRTRGYSAPPGRTLLGMTAWQFVVVQHAARRIAAPDCPDDAFHTGCRRHGRGRLRGRLDGPDAPRPEARPRPVPRLPRASRAGRRRAGLALLTPRCRRSGPGPGEPRVLVERPAARRLRGAEVARVHGLLPRPADLVDLGYDGPMVGRPARGWR